VIATIGRSRVLAWLLVSVLTLVAPLPLTPAAPPPPGMTTAFTPEQLDQLTAPIALYPDPLLAQVLMASTYPLEVVQAARFARTNPNLKGDQLNEKLKEQTWDDSVKSLVSFPQVLDLMDQKLDWVQKLGDAFLAQQKDLMDAVQRLRARAQAEGNLKSTPEQTVTVEPAPAAPPPPGQPPQTVVVQQPPTVITIQPANPQVIYVPAYNPTVVYGPWPYPAYPPYYPYPPGYVFGTAALSFGLGMAVGAAVWGNCNWNSGHVDVNINNYNSYSNTVNRTNVANERVSHYQQGQGGNRSEWKHNPENRRGVQYRDQATQQRYNRAGNPRATQSREAFRGRAEQGRQELARGGAGSPGGGAQGGGRARQQGGAQAGARPRAPGGAQAGVRPQARGGAQAGARGPTTGGAQGSLGGRDPGAFQGMGAGGDARNYSNRGQASRQSSFGASAAHRGGSRPSAGSSGGGRSGGGGRGGGRR
jgi:hypothetical protein